jgi:hypothetical protein
MAQNLIINNSRIKALQQCEAKAYFQFIEKIKVPNTSALMLGSAIDHTVNKNYEHKIKTERDYRLDYVTDIFSDEFNKLRKETEFGKKEKPGELKDLGVKMVKSYHSTIAPKVKPKTVQRVITVDFPELGFSFQGTIDREDGAKAEGLKDVKTRKQSPSLYQGVYQPDYRDAIQLKSYGIAKLAKKEPLKQIQVEYIVKLKEPKTIIVDVPHPSKADLEYFKKSLAWTNDRFQGLMNETVAVIPNRFDMMCSKKYCKFWNICEKRFGGRVKE